MARMIQVKGDHPQGSAALFKHSCREGAWDSGLQFGEGFRRFWLAAEHFQRPTRRCEESYFRMLGSQAFSHHDSVAHLRASGCRVRNAML